MVDFSKNPTAKGFFAPQRFEADVFDCEVVGKVPTALNGAFVRLGGMPQYPALHADDSPFNDDGYMSMFRFRNGIVDFKGRWVKTERFKRSLAADRQLYGYYRNPYTDDPSVKDIAHPNRRTVSNTTPLAHAGKLFALKEDGLPYEMNPKTLDTIGTWDFHGKYKSQTFTAHPKVDPITGDMITYGYEATGLATDDLWLYVIDKKGNVKREVRVKVPYVSMIHDIALTPKHIIIPVFGYVTNLERLKAGKIHWAWDNSVPNYYGVIPRDGDAKDIRWFKGPQRGIVHTLNGRDQGSKVILEAPIFDGNPFPFFPYVDGSKFDPMKARGYFRRITFDMSSKDDGVTEEILIKDPAVVDLARIDERHMGQPYRYGFTGYTDAARPFDEARAGNLRGRVTNCYGKFDIEAGKLASAYFGGPTHSLQEVTFVPRSKTAPEGDGYLIGVANNYADMRSELVIADTADLAAGDVARVILPFRSNVQVHGRWYGDDEVKFG
ncbi:MAG: carotenoid oxygenase family protein [Caulobacteraceae bacterium]